MDNKNNINISLIDYIGKIENGVGVILSLMLNDIHYELIYWFNPENDNISIKIEEKFYENYRSITDISEYKYTPELIYYIDHKLLPPREEIYKEFLN